MTGASLANIDLMDEGPQLGPIVLSLKLPLLQYPAISLEGKLHFKENFGGVALNLCFKEICRLSDHSTVRYATDPDNDLLSNEN